MSPLQTTLDSVHSKIMKASFAVILFVAGSCSDAPKNVRTVLESSGKNRAELEKVIEHYKVLNDEKKLNAVYFLIGNMGNKYSLEGPFVRNFDPIFDTFDSLHQKKIKFGNTSPYIQQKWNALVKLHGSPTPEKAEKIAYKENIKADYLIEQIDYSFKAWEVTSWSKKLSFEHFCEYILPYRINTEPLEPWKKYLYEKYGAFRDTMMTKNCFANAEAINHHLAKQINTNHTMWAYPFGIPVTKMEKAKRGACNHVVSYTAMVLRSNGIPVSIDYVKMWGNRNNSHSWNALLTEDGKFVPFDAAKGEIKGADTFVYKFAKAYRESFQFQESNLPENSHHIPQFLIDPNSIDVTDEYTKAFDVSVPLKYPFREEKKYAVICTFDNKDWVPQDLGTVENDHARFKKMGSDIMYIVMYYHNGNYYPATDPFILEVSGSLRIIDSSEKKTQAMVLLRKYPLFKPQITNLNKIVGGRLQGANKADFRDSVNLFTISEYPQKFEEVTISLTQKFRYVRFISPPNKPAIVAELEFYTNADSGKQKKLEGKIIAETQNDTEYPPVNAFDSNLGTYFNGKKGKFGWVGLDLGKAQVITKIRYSGQNDTNFIIPGNRYELFYWDKTEWMSLGEQLAEDQKLIFDNVPSDRVYLLHNLTGGKEERIFTYENGQQVWW